ncbi:hypothetical protein HMPREF0653_02347 [Prevotella disiens JCM 6334 = ATCC 29426]|nr:AAA family ATPase [Prevotella disiens]ERJ72537.1 hypothetical protein HMPREF0653_02347 [Prevotella disiens JCM 6334 = ATCC 29426]
MGQIIINMNANSLKTQRFRANDLVDNGGKQFEMGKGWCQEFFEIDNSIEEITLQLTFKALSNSQQSLDNTKIELKLSDVNTRGDRKAYANGENGHSQIKDFFINKLHLTTSNLTDYFALYKKNSKEYNLYYVPKLLYDNFICLFNNGLEISYQENSRKGFDLADSIYNYYRPYITAIKSKPFLLLAGISGTGKSRIVRELARACWEEGTDEYKAQKPKNFQMVQVKPNWHDSSDLIGYVSRVSGKAEFVAGEFLKFIAKAWEDVETPYFLCLDEMNLAPVEQYFAEYLSVIESRKSHEEGTVTTDPILEKSAEDWYRVLTSELTNEDNVRNRFLEEGICIPQNLIVVGTVNMDETTFSFSRKVLDRAMTIEMNEVDLYGGLTKRHESIGKLDNAELVGSAVEGVDIYNDNTDVCDIALRYLQKINDVLEGTPFKIAYRTRNEFLLYVVNNLPYCKDENGNDLEQGYVIARALDEITSMKVLSRIEGDDTKVSDNFLDSLSKTVEEGLKAVSGEENIVKSISLAKLKEMKDKLVSGYTSFWS